MLLSLSLLLKEAMVLQYLYGRLIKIQEDNQKTSGKIPACVDIGERVLAKCD